MNLKWHFILILIFTATSIFSQQWQQTTAIPEGGGVTEIVVRESNGDIFVTTGSYNYPSGPDGGIRKSTNDGASWTNVFDAYTGRTITDGADGNLYASVWPYPSNEGLYRSTDNGSTWNLLTTVPSGNNIFAIAVNINSPSVTIFAGTRQGVYRSTNNGTSWAYANTGLPVNAWVRDIEVDSSGNVAVATLAGLFISMDNGNSWTQATGIAAGDTIVKIVFDYPLIAKKNETRLLGGSNRGSLMQSFRNASYTTMTLCALFTSGETSGFCETVVRGMNFKKHGVSHFPTNNQGGGFRSSSDDGVTWQQNNNGLPANPKASALSGKVEESGGQANIKYFLGTYDNTSSGAKVYSTTYTITSLDQDPSALLIKYRLDQNYPNPFNPKTTIEFSIPKTEYVTLKIYNLLGQEVATLVSDKLAPDNYKYIWDASGLVSGIYYYKIEAGKFQNVKKLILLR